MLSAIELIAGIVIIIITLHEVFHAVVVPRWSPTRYRLAPILTGAFFWNIWKWSSRFIGSERLKELHLGSYAPMSILFLLTAWMSALALGFALLLMGCGADTIPPIAGLSEAIYYAGAALCTMGVGNVTVIGTIPRLIVLSAAFFGMAVMAMIVSFLFTLYSAVQTRETTVNIIQLQAGMPLSGLGLLQNCANLELQNELPSMFANWQVWISHILETHRAYPVLQHFRSSEIGISWVSSMYVILDAAAIVISSIDNLPKGHANLLHRIGSKTAWELYNVFSLDIDPTAHTLNKEDFQTGLKYLASAGYTISTEDDSYEDFLELRSAYAPPLEAIMQHLDHVSIGW